MDSMQDLLKVHKPTKSKWNFKSRRQELIQMYVDRINLGRKNTTFPPMTAKRLNSQYLWALDTFDLEVFFKECCASDNFGKKFFGSFKNKSNYQISSAQD